MAAACKPIMFDSFLVFLHNIKISKACLWRKPAFHQFKRMEKIYWQNVTAQKCGKMRSGKFVEMGGGGGCHSGQFYIESCKILFTGPKFVRVQC